MKIANSVKALDRIRAGDGRFDAFHLEMLEKEPPVVVVIMEALRRQHRRDDRHLGRQLDAHERPDDRLGDEFMTIDAAIDTKPAATIAAYRPVLARSCA